MWYKWYRCYSNEFELQNMWYSNEFFFFFWGNKDTVMSLSCSISHIIIRRDIVMSLNWYISHNITLKYVIFFYSRICDIVSRIKNVLCFYYISRIKTILPDHVIYGLRTVLLKRNSILHFCFRGNYTSRICDICFELHFRDVGAQQSKWSNFTQTNYLNKHNTNKLFLLL